MLILSVATLGMVEVIKSAGIKVQCLSLNGGAREEHPERYDFLLFSH